jgi:hypothetical protein
MKKNERGSAMLVTLIILAALLAGAVVIAQMQQTSTRSADVVRTGMSSVYCAEAGLAAARPVVAANYAQWGAALAQSGAATPNLTEPAWLSAGIGSHDLDGDGVADFTVYIRDNDDEVPPAPNDRTIDRDLAIYVVSTCIKYPDTQHAVEELVRLQGGGTCYKSQIGGCRNDNNTN